MHLEGPWLTTTGKQRGKKKWMSAEQKRQAEILNTEWEKIKTKYIKPTTAQTSIRKTYSPPVNPRLAEIRKIPSLDTGVVGAVTIRQPMQYTGTKVKGIGTMHKSNAVPIFTDDEAVDIAHMRR
jgi:hypothetical protein